MLAQCPGAGFLRTPELKIKKCPQCGSEVEVFSVDVKVKCEKCGFTVYNDRQSCAQWCRYARQCLGDELYERLTAGKGGNGANGQEKNHPH
ncbi:MAG: hypothetical protein H5U01_16265 [Clostridia bacterium]|nr:hypothetical protein [Clostridia bacterium]